MSVLPCLDTDLSWTYNVRFEVSYSCLFYLVLIQTCPGYRMLDLRLATHVCPSLP